PPPSARRHGPARFTSAKVPAPVSSQVKIAGTEKSQESNDDPINAYNSVQQPGHDQNEKTADSDTSGAGLKGIFIAASFFIEDDGSIYWDLTPCRWTVLVRFHVFTRDTIAQTSRAICDILATNIGIVRKSCREGEQMHHTRSALHRPRAANRRRAQAQPAFKGYGFARSCWEAEGAAHHS